MEHLADHRLGALATPLDAPHAAVGVDGRAARHGVRQIGERGALLGVHRTTHPAVAGTQAAAHVAADRVHGPPELLATVVERPVVGVDLLEIDFLDPEPPLDLLEVGSQSLWRQHGALLVAPEGEHVVGSAEARGPVHHRAAADRASLQDRDGQIGGRPVPAVLVQPRIGGRLLHVELVLAVVAALLEHHHARPRLREARGDDRAAGPAPDDADVGREEQVLAHLVAAHDAAHGRPLAAFTVRTNSSGGPG